MKIRTPILITRCPSQPKHAIDNQIKNLQRSLKNQKKTVADATKKLEETRKAFLEKQGSSSTDKAKNIEEQVRLKCYQNFLDTTNLTLHSSQTKIEEELEQAKEKLEKYNEKIEQYLDLHEDAKEKVDAMGENVNDLYGQIREQERLIKELQSGKGGGVAMFGEKAPAMIAKVKAAQKKGQLRGNVFGPVGSFVQVKRGKESWAKLAEAAIGNVGLATFVCDDKADVGLLRRFRKEVGCRDMDIPIAHHHPGPRYKTPKGVEGVTGIELAINCVTVEEDLVFNFLCDSSRAERKALAPSKEIGEKKLMATHNGRRVMLDKNVQECIFQPQGDSFLVKNGYYSVRSNDNG
jgi:chromosome segregation ATPase